MSVDIMNILAVLARKLYMHLKKALRATISICCLTSISRK